MNPTKADIFTLEEFAGEIFQYLQRFKCFPEGKSNNSTKCSTLESGSTQRVLDSSQNSIEDTMQSTNSGKSFTLVDESPYLAPVSSKPPEQLLGPPSTPQPRASSTPLSELERQLQSAGKKPPGKKSTPSSPFHVNTPQTPCGATAEQMLGKCSRNSTTTRS
ncbi:Protein of unknown function [Cotesia congregata]|uniref:Uncharacterized protein n=1 Tax=Cotesia congregata TaxID=51543 RepID=A0A8J2MJM1_COTCN|nr:Protein of unknown function [Cotesia congregata]